MKINKYMRVLIFCVVFVILYWLIDYTTKRWLTALHDFEYFYLVEPVLALLICGLLERIFYDFDPSHNGNVKLKSKK